MDLDESSLWGYTTPFYDNTIFESRMFQEMIHVCIKYNLTFNRLKGIIKHLLYNGYSLQFEQQYNILMGNSSDSQIIDSLREINNLIWELDRGYYIYRLIDPEDFSTFYIGKGLKSRLMEHEIYSQQNVHYNKELQNRIKEIKDREELIIYEIDWHVISDSEDAYRIENEVYNDEFDCLLNGKSGQKTYQINMNNIDLLERLLHNYNLWTNTVEDFDKLKVSDKILMIYFILKSIIRKKCWGISDSFRDMALAIGVNPPVIKESIKHLIKYGFLKIIYKGKGGYASKYSITDKVINSVRDMQKYRKCNDFEHIYDILILLQDDAFRYGALNKSGLYIVLQFVLNPDTSFSRKELIKLTGMSRQTVNRSIDEMVKYSILKEKDKAYSLNRSMVMDRYECSYVLDDIAAIKGKTGRYKYYKDLYDWERYIYTGVHLKYRIENNIDIPLNELLVLEIIENSLTRNTRLYPDPSIGSPIVQVPKKEGVIYV